MQIARKLRVGCAAPFFNGRSTALKWYVYIIHTFTERENWPVVNICFFPFSHCCGICCCRHLFGERGAAMIRLAYNVWLILVLLCTKFFILGFWGKLTLDKNIAPLIERLFCVVSNVRGGAGQAARYGSDSQVKGGAIHSVNRAISLVFCSFLSSPHFFFFFLGHFLGREFFSFVSEGFVLERGFPWRLTTVTPLAMAGMGLFDGGTYCEEHASPAKGCERAR